MLRFLYYRAVYGPYLRSTQGVQDMAEVTVSKLVREVLGKAAQYESSHVNLEAERQHVLGRLKELTTRAPLMSPGELSSARSRMWIGLGVLAGLMLAAFVLYFGILSALIDGNALFRWGLAGLIAGSLAFGGMHVCERLMESVYPKAGCPERQGQAVRAVLWTLLLGAVEAAVVMLCAGRHAGAGTDVAALSFYYGTLLVALLLPLLGGLVYWDTVRSLDDYKNAAARQRMEDRMAELEAAVRRNGDEQVSAFRTRSVTHWCRLQGFRVYKERYDARNGYSEDLSEHFASSYEQFEQEAERRVKRLAAASVTTQERAAIQRVYPAEEQYLSIVRTGRSYLHESDAHLAAP